MAFTITKRGKLTYYSEGDAPVLSALVTEAQPGGDLRIHFAGLTGGYSARGVLSEIDFIEMHVFGCQPKAVNPLVDPAGYQKEVERLRAAYGKAYRNWWATHCPGNGLPCRFTVHVVDVPDRAASYEFYSVGLLQRDRSAG